MLRAAASAEVETGSPLRLALVEVIGPPIAPTIPAATSASGQRKATVAP
jgi:hypothetical protein